MVREDKKLKAGGFWFAISLSVSLFVTTGISGCGGGGNPTPAPTPAPTPVPTPAPLPYWHMCKDGACWHYPMKAGDQSRKWNKSPSSLKVDTSNTAFPALPDSWQNLADTWDASPPKFKGARVKLSDVMGFVSDLLSSDPFGSGDDVPYADLGDPVEASGEKVVAITQRQLAFIVANELMNNTIDGEINGLRHALDNCPHHSQTVWMKSLVSLLAVLSQELKDGGDGNTIIAATPKHMSDGKWQDKLETSNLTDVNICNRISGAGDNTCQPEDFMTGGTGFRQALTDIAGAEIGGGAQLCEIANSQDESLVQFYSEVLALAFFVTHGGGNVMLPTPLTVFGARRYVNTISGETSRDHANCGEFTEKDWLNEDIGDKTESVTLGDQPVKVASSTFTAVASEVSQAHAGADCNLGDLQHNNCDAQRHFFDKDISRWYQAFESTMYNKDVQSVAKTLIGRIGTGPWGSGVWYGDSQIYSLTMWLATSLLDGVKFDYYLYDHFCENPGNQCFVLAEDDCKSCLQTSQTSLNNLHCSKNGLKDMISQFKGKTAKDLHDALTNKVGKPPMHVFDYIAGEPTPPPSPAFV